MVTVVADGFPLAAGLFAAQGHPFHDTFHDSAELQNLRGNRQ